MKQFRQKLAIILVESNPNKLKGSPIYYQSDDESNSEVEFLYNSPDGVKDKLPTSIPIMLTYPHNYLLGCALHHIDR